MVLDSLESRADCVSTENWKTLMKVFAAMLAESPGDVTALHIGTGGATPSGMGWEAANPPALPTDYSAYRDSKTQYRVSTLVPSIAPKPSRSEPAFRPDKGPNPP